MFYALYRSVFVQGFRRRRPVGGWWVCACAISVTGSPTVVSQNPGASHVCDSSARLVSLHRSAFVQDSRRRRLGRWLVGAHVPSPLQVAPTVVSQNRVRRVYVTQRTSCQPHTGQSLCKFSSSQARRWLVGMRMRLPLQVAPTVVSQTRVRRMGCDSSARLVNTLSVFVQGFPSSQARRWLVGMRMPSVTGYQL